MQLRPKKKKKVGKLLASASMALLCHTTQVAKAQEPVQSVTPPKGFFTRNVEGLTEWAKWSGQIGFLGYSETNNRVQAWEPAVQLNAEFDGEKVWSTKLVFDSLSGASPNGALNSSQPQTFTSPSGSASYRVAPNTQPLYSQFKDSRIALSTSWSQPLSRLWKYSVGFNGSSEYDYLSLGVNASVSKDSEDKNRTWTVGVSYTNDQIKPVGSIPVPLASMGGVSSVPRLATSDSKTTADFLFGLSQVINRKWLIQTNISLGQSSGYMNDPYKFVTIYEDVNPGTLGDPTNYIYESRPDSRFKKSFFIGSKNSFSSGILTTSYRFFVDDWGLNSHTLEGRFNFALSETWRLEPGFRYYKQGAADFYRLGIGQSSPTPSHVSADYRLGDLTTMAPTIKIIRKLKDDKELSLLLRYYLQKGDTSSFTPVGSQIGQDLIPNTEAYMVQIHYSF